ncbi:hypothetical protein [Roseofilum casamattae]|nr:hypothetical protein [Roseofilum casamattae]
MTNQIVRSQETIYRYFVTRVKQESPETVLAEFKCLFIDRVEIGNIDANKALFNLAFANQKNEFIYTLKRCCYILINNWEASRHHEAVRSLVRSFEQNRIDRTSHAIPEKRLRAWIVDFIQSPDYEEIKLFSQRFDKDVDNWSERYSSYLLVSQYTNSDNSAEQRHAAKMRSQELKEQFKFDLAMYTTRLQLSSDAEPPSNPTQLGDKLLHLIKTILLRKGPYNYVNLSRIFLKQIQGIRYDEFKIALQRYLHFAIDDSAFTQLMDNTLGTKFDALYREYDEQPITKALLLRTCNRAVEFMTTEDRHTPSPLFALWVAQNNPLTLVTIMLKLILISKSTRVHLEARIADLIRYYKDYPEDECKWLINFMEVLNIAFAIYADNVQYNLIRIDRDSLGGQSAPNLDKYRVFSQLHLDRPLDFVSNNQEDASTEN